MKVAVIGAGIVGSSIAYHLAGLGAAVTVFDSARPGGGTSSATAAYINYLAKDPDHYFALHREAIAYWHRFAEALSIRQHLHLDGALYWQQSGDEAGFEARVKRAADAGAIIEHVRVDHVEPLIEKRLPEAVRVGDEGWVDVLPVITGTLRALIELGGVIRSFETVDAVEKDAAGWVVAAAGAAHAFDRVVLATGPETEAFARDLGIAIPVKRDPGVIAVTTPSTLDVRHTIHDAGFNFRPDAGGRLLIRPGNVEQRVSFDQRELFEEEVLSELAEWIPAARGLRLETLKIGVRPVPADGLPIVGPVSSAEGIYVAASHSAINLAPYFGKLAAQEIHGGQLSPALDRYRLERFA